MSDVVARPVSRNNHVWRLVFLLLPLASVLVAHHALPVEPPTATPIDDPKSQRNRVVKDLEQAKVLGAAGKLKDAAVAANRALETGRNVLRSDPEMFVALLIFVADTDDDAEQLADARKLRDEVVAFQAKRFGKGHWQTTDARLAAEKTALLATLSADHRRQLTDANHLNEKVVALFGQEKYPAALELADRIADTRGTILGKKHPDYAASLNDLAELHCKLREYTKAEPLFQQAIAIRKQVLGEMHPSVAASMTDLALLYKQTGDYAKAEPLYQQAIVIRKESLGEENSDYATSLGNLGALYKRMRQFAKAEPLFRQAMAIDKKTLGPMSPDYATDAANLSSLYYEMGRYSAAEPLLQEALAIRKQVLGEKHPDYATSLGNLARLYERMGDYGKAAALFKQAVAICKESGGGNDNGYLFNLNNLAYLYYRMGDYAKAEQLFRQLAAITKQTRGEKHADYATTLNNLALVYQEMGDFDQAELLYRQALAIEKESLGEKQSGYAVSLNNLATLYDRMGDHAKAKPLYEQALAIDKTALGISHPDYATDLNNLAYLYQETGEYQKAKPLFQEALSVTGKALGEKHPAYATGLNNLAILYGKMGDYASAEQNYLRAISIVRETLGETNSDYAADLSSLAVLYYRMGDEAKAAAFSKQALEITRTQRDLFAGVQSERQQLRMADMERWIVGGYLSIADAAGVPAEQVYAEVLGWKGAVSAEQHALRRMRQSLDAAHDTESVQLFNDLAAASRGLATESLRAAKPGAEAIHRKKLADLSEQIERLQRALASKNEEFRRQQSQQHRTPADIRQALPPNVVLIDQLEYNHCAPANARGNELIRERRLAAFVVARDKPIERVELGPVAPIRRAVDVWRWRNVPHPAIGSLQPDERRAIEAALAAWEREQANADPGQKLREWVWDKLQPHFPGAKVVLLSPDGAAARFSWPALPGKNPGTYLIDEIAVAVVPVPRLLPELLGPAEPKPSDDHSVLLVGGVDFGSDPGGQIGDVALDRSAPRGDQPFHFQSLPGTAVEVAAVRAAFARRYSNSAPMELTGAGATKSAVRRAMGECRFLHFATHGFFAPPRVKSAMSLSPSQGDTESGETFGRRGVTGFHPDLLSGLALAGANRPVADGQDDGILTALEVSALDLSRVELATLSACETGLGESAGGEGLLGLQRAFQIAGAKTVVASLWEVPDVATQALMSRFYDNLWNKKLGKLESLLEAQRWMLREGRQHPELFRGQSFLPESGEATLKSGRMPPEYWAAFILSGDWR